MVVRQLLLGIVACVACGTAPALPSPAAQPTRPCGALAIGIGWHVRASRGVACSSARHLILTYFHRGAERRPRAVIMGYACTTRYLPDAEHIDCLRATKRVTAKSFGY